MSFHYDKVPLTHPGYLKRLSDVFGQLLWHGRTRGYNDLACGSDLA